MQGEDATSTCMLYPSVGFLPLLRLNELAGPLAGETAQGVVEPTCSCQALEWEPSFDYKAERGWWLMMIAMNG